MIWPCRSISHLMAPLEAYGFTQQARGLPKIRILTRFRTHQFSQRLGDNIEFFLGSFLRAATGVLKQRHQQQRQDTGNSVNNRVPCLVIFPQGEAGQPGHDDADTQDKERRPADLVVGSLDEPVKQRTAISLCAALCGLAAFHG